jgi:multidrug resistance efflux pump
VKEAKDAQSTLEDAQKDLDEARSLSPEIKAPFDGFITTVNGKGGDEVKPLHSDINDRF